MIECCNCFEWYHDHGIELLMKIYGKIKTVLGCARSVARSIAIYSYIAIFMHTCIAQVAHTAIL